MRLTKYNSIDEIIDDLIPVFANHNGLVPMDWTPARKKVMFSLSYDFTNRIIELDNVLTDKIIIENYVSPSHYIKAAHKFQNAGRLLNLDKTTLTTAYINLCNAAVIGWKSEVNKIMLKLSSIEFSRCEGSIQEKIAYLNSIVRAFSETVYCDDHTIGGDICGPIDTEDGVLIVREYIRLRPIELFEILADFNISSVVTYCIYENSNISVDLIGNFTQCNDISKSLTKYYIEVTYHDGETTTIQDDLQLDQLISLFEEWIIKTIQYYKGLDECLKNKLLFKCEFYAFKPLFDACGISWEPNSYDIIEKSASNSSILNYRKKLASANTEEDLLKYTRAILDPRL